MPSIYSCRKMLAGAGLLLAAALLGGCDWSDPMAKMYNDPGPALSDPMHYSPDADNADDNSGIGSYDNEAMQQDLNVLELKN